MESKSKNEPDWTPRPRIAVVTLYDHAQYDLANITAPNHAAYCRHNGYSYLSHCGRLDTSRAASWSKLLLVSRVLPLFDFVLWTDTDTVFTDYGRIEECIIPHFSGAGRILCHAQPNRFADSETTRPEDNLNCGVMCFQNTPKTQELIFQIYGQHYQADYPWWEQQAVLSLKQWGSKFIDVAPLDSFVCYPDPSGLDDSSTRSRLIYHAFGPVKKELLCKHAVSDSEVT